MKKGKRYPVEVLTAAEARSLVDACSGTCPSGIRNQALIVTLYRAGLRVSEALGLYPKDVDSFAGTIRILEGKGRKARTVGLDPKSFEILNKWKIVREGLGIDRYTPLFCTLNGRRIYTSYVRALFC